MNSFNLIQALMYFACTITFVSVLMWVLITLMLVNMFVFNVYMFMNIFNVLYICK
jgi:hypothetical protein